jgi:anthranilate/para-aminobenzoate synthase component I
MDKKQFPALDPLNVFQQLPADVDAPFFSWSDSQRGWKKILAFDPIDQLTFYPGNSLENVYQFCEKHSGKFLAGYLSFELGYQLLEIETTRQPEPSVPVLHFRAYGNYIEFEKDRTICFYTDPEFPLRFAEMLSSEEAVTSRGLGCRLSAELDATAYQKNFSKIIDYIKAGDIYQINYTHLMRGKTNLSGRELFVDFTGTNPVDHAVYWELDDMNIISLSPESFARIEKDIIITKPIKGTRPRGSTLEEDTLQIKELLESQKEQAELFMITDLLRNDVGKVSRVGSVKVVHQKKLQTLAKVFHTYSRVEGRRRPDISNIEALISMFPGGSITGCPKKRAVEIIQELEDHPRGIYTGSIGYILPNQDMEFNIAIRTVIQQGNSLTLGVGGGITVGSDVNDEYHECFAKARSFLNPN